MEADLGVRPPDDARGCMQDVHWYCMSIGGAFQGYALGNLMAAQFFEAAREALPELDDHIIRGDFAPLRTWLADNVHSHGARYLPDELIERATGKPLSIAPFVRHLKKKYGALYDIAFD